MLTETQLQRLRQVKGEALTPEEQYGLLAMLHGSFPRML